MILLFTPFQQHFLNTLRIRQNGCHFAEDILRCIFQWLSLYFDLNFNEAFFNDHLCILIWISMKFLITGPWATWPTLHYITILHAFSSMKIFECQFHWNVFLRVRWQHFSIGLGYGLVSSDNKPLPGPMLSKISQHHQTKSWYEV